jgi:hypothetical protein
VAITPPVITPPPVVKQPRPSPSPFTSGINSPALFCVKYTRCKPRINPGEPVVISTNVINEGDQAGNYNVVLKINGKVEQQKMVSVGPRVSSPINFTVTKSDPGTYNVSIDNDHTTFVIMGPESHVNTGPNAGPVVAIIGGIILAMFITVLLLIRRRSEVS